MGATQGWARGEALEGQPGTEEPGQAPGSARAAGKGIFHAELTPPPEHWEAGWDPQAGMESPIPGEGGRRNHRDQPRSSIPEHPAGWERGCARGGAPRRGRSGDGAEPVRSGQK